MGFDRTAGDRIQRRGCGRAGLLACTFFTAVPVMAQEVNTAGAAPTDTSQSTDTPQTQLQDIVVTAQRRSQNLQDTPISVSAFNGQQLQASGVANVRELVQVDPSLNIQHSAGVYLPFLRGIGNGAAGTVGNEASVAVCIDDVYYTRLSSAYFGISSIDRVEVLKGPQGTLFGRNSSGGAIQMFTRDPDLQKSQFDATIGYGNYDTVSGQLYASTPITDNLAWNVSVGGSDQQSGWGRSITTGRDAYLEHYATVRSKLIWEPGSRTKVKIVGFYAYQRGDIGETEDRHSGSYGATPGIPIPGYLFPPLSLPSLADVPGNHFYDDRLSFHDYQREQGYGGSLRIDQGIGFADLVSITAFRNSKGNGHQDSDYSPQNFYNTDLRDIDRQFTEELQIKSRTTSRISWIVGGLYLHSKAGYNPAQVTGDLISVAVAPGATENLYGIQTINSYSAYGQATAPLGKRTNITLGLRYTNDHVAGRGQTTATVPGVGTLPVSPETGSAKTFQRVTWKGALDHHFTDDLMVYASVSRGYKAGTFNTLPLGSSPALPEIVDAYEIGAKLELFDRRVRVNGALFWNDIKNPQVITFISQGVAAGVGLTNAQKARIRGGEIGIEAVAADGLKLRGAATYLDGKFVKFTNAPFYSLNGVTLTGPVPGDATGNRLPNVPRWRFDVGANYTAALAGGKLVGDVSTSYTGRFAWNADNRISEKAVALVNASLNFTPSSIGWLSVGVWGKNLADVHYYSASQEFAGPAGVGGDIAAAAAPRTFGGSVSVKF